MVVMEARRGGWRDYKAIDRVSVWSSEAEIVRFLSTFSRAVFVVVVDLSELFRRGNSVDMVGMGEVLSRMEQLFGARCQNFFR